MRSELVWDFTMCKFLEEYRSYDMIFKVMYIKQKHRLVCENYYII
jgi:hypothetical protein